jgi:hypothetical protein
MRAKSRELIDRGVSIGYEKAADILAALAAAGVDREDTEQPRRRRATEADWAAAAKAWEEGEPAELHRDLLRDTGQADAEDAAEATEWARAVMPAQHRAQELVLGGAGQADEPQRQRVLSGLAAHREAQRLGRPARTTPVDDALASGGSFQRAGQVVPQQPTCEHGETEAHDYRIYTFGGRPYEALCPGPVGQDIAEVCETCGSPEMDERDDECARLEAERDAVEKLCDEWLNAPWSSPMLHLDQGRIDMANRVLTAMGRCPTHCSCESHPKGISE